MTKKTFCFMLSLFFELFAYTLSSAQSPPLFGPNKYERTTGAPNVYSDAFQSCNTGATYNLIVENGEGGKNRISSASIILNGIEIAKESEFNQKVDKIEKTISLQSENTFNIKLSSGPGGFIKVSVYCIANCLEVKITSPATGNTVNKSKTIIQGNLYNVFGETGVVLQSSGTSGQTSGLAQAQGNSFAGLVPLQQGQNTITAQATDACGYQVTDSITINTESIAEPIRLTALPSSGIPDITTGTFETTLEGEANISNPVSNYQWDTNGDGAIDQQGSSLSKITASYQATGLYFPQVTITDTQGNTFTETTIVNVLSREEMDALLKGKWDGMKGKLVSGNVEKALSYFSEASQEKYGEVFNLLKDKLSSLGAEMQDIEFLYLKGNTAKYRIKRNQTIDGQGISVTYYIYFTIDKNGLWKIVSF